MNFKISGSFFRWAFYFLFFLMFVFPMVIELLYFKALLFGLLVFFYFLALIKKDKFSLPLHPMILQLTLLIFFAGVMFCFEGLVLKAPGVFKQAQVYIFWPLIYIFLLTSLKDLKLFIGLQRTIVISTIFLSLYGLVHFLANISILPKFFGLPLFHSEVIGYGYYDGFMAMTLPGVNSLPFLVPYCFTAIFFWIPGKENSPLSRKWLWTALILGLIFSLITARKAVWLVLILAPMMIFLFKLLVNPYINRRINIRKSINVIFFSLLILVTIYIFVTSVYKFDLDKLFKKFIDGFTFTAKDDARKQQFFALIRGWWEHPLFGSGLGATAAKYGSIRSIDSPWSYELYYLALLFQVGIIGFIIYTSGVVWTYIRGIKMMKSSIVQKAALMPFIIGMTCMFIAGGTNPVFIRFDGIWFFFIPLVLINNWMVIRSSKN